MKLIARLFALSLVVTGAVASTQIERSTDGVVLGAKMGMMPPAVCPPDGGGCHLGD